MSRKRFTDADKWEDPWFSELSETMKLFWIYLCDQCDNAGVWQVNWKLARFHVGASIDADQVITVLGERIVQFANGRKWFVPRFLTFQYPTGLNEKCPPHKRIIAILTSHGIDPVTRVVTTLTTRVKTTLVEEDREVEVDLYQGGAGGGEDVFANPTIVKAMTHPAPGPIEKSFGDWLTMHNRVFVNADDRDEWEALFRRAGYDVMSQAHTAIIKILQPGKKVFFSSVRDYILANFEEVPNGNAAQG
jgi:hypothetical protein